jgi:hypothetical protein
MGRVTKHFVDEDPDFARKKRIKSLWRGIGCLLIVILGFLGYYASGWLLQANAKNHWVYIPPELYYPSFAPWLPPGILIRVAIGVLLVMLGFGVLNVVYAVLFPIKPSETDVPPMSPLDRRKL